jgi:hypothetical protein
MGQALLDCQTSIYNTQFAMGLRHDHLNFLDITRYSYRGQDKYFGHAVHRMLNHANLCFNEELHLHLASPLNTLQRILCENSYSMNRRQALNPPEQQAWPSQEDSPLKTPTTTPAVSHSSIVQN